MYEAFHITAAGGGGGGGMQQIFERYSDGKCRRISFLLCHFKCCYILSLYLCWDPEPIYFFIDSNLFSLSAASLCKDIYSAPASLSLQLMELVKDNRSETPNFSGPDLGSKEPPSTNLNIKGTNI